MSAQPTIEAARPLKEGNKSSRTVFAYKKGETNRQNKTATSTIFNGEIILCQILVVVYLE